MITVTMPTGEAAVIDGDGKWTPANDQERSQALARVLETMTSSTGPDSYLPEQVAWLRSAELAAAEIGGTVSVQLREAEEPAELTLLRIF